MKKNNIFIVIDSLYYDKTIKTDNHPATMPFLDKLRDEGLNYTNMYSEAPYTEAALVSLLCGMDTLKKGGYVKKLYNKETIMETLQKNGYETFCNCVQPLVYPSYSYQGLDYEYYNICYDFETLWAYRLYFYSDLYNNDKLDDKSLELVIDLLSDNLYTWQSFMQELKKNDSKVSFIYQYVEPTNLDLAIEELATEIAAFNKDKKKYTTELLKLKKEHPLFKIKTYNLSKKMDVENMKKLYHRYKPLIRKVRAKNFKYNFLNNPFRCTKSENFKGMLKSYLNAIYNRFLIKKIDYHIASKKAAPSMLTTINHFESWLSKRDNDKPYFAYLHFDDCHSSEIFYSYDCPDFKELDYEFSLIKGYLTKLPKKYKGSISYDISLQYADMCLKRLYQYLAEHHLLDDTNIIICADHGSSYTFDPYRENYVNNVHRENYNIPFVIWSKNLKHQVKDGYYNTKDIPATILDLNNLKPVKEYDGISSLKNPGRDYVLLENVKGGCPDYNYREIMLGVRNKKWLVVMEFDMSKKFEDGKLMSVYNLKNDPHEYQNLASLISKSLIKEELSNLEKEFNNLQKDIKTNNFINW